MFTLYTRWSVWGAALLAAMMLSLPAAATDDDGEELVKVVYHADFADPKRFGALVTMVNNMVAFYENEFQEYDIRIVFVAHGVRFVTGDSMAGTGFATDEAMELQRESLKGRLLSLHSSRDVKLELCDNTRNGAKLGEDSLYEGVELVPSGVVRLAELQHQGFAYIKVQ